MYSYINIYSYLILSTWCHHPYLLRLFHYFSFFSFHCCPQTNAMMTSSKMNCGTIHVSLHILKWLQALIYTRNKKSPAVLKKKCSGTSKNRGKGGGGPKPLMISFHHLLLLHPKKLTQLSIKFGCCFL